MLPPAVPRQTAPAATPETIEVQVPPGAVPGSTLEFELDDGRTIDVPVPEGARAGDRFQVPLSLAAAAPPAESIEMQEELRADTRAAETGPTAAERSLPLWAEYIQNNDESSDDDSSYVPDYNSDGETIIDETSDSDSNIEMQEELGADIPPPPPVNVKAKKTLTKKEIKKMTKEIKAKIKSGAELDEDEEAFAEEHELWK
jgi:hypothetical protein